MAHAFSLVLYWLVAALTLWAVVFRFIPFCWRALRDEKAELRALADAEERVMLKSIALRERHDVLRDALVTLVAMHRGGPDAVSNWDWALDRAEKALALTATPLLAEKKSP